MDVRLYGGNCPRSDTVLHDQCKPVAVSGVDEVAVRRREREAKLEVIELLKTDKNPNTRNRFNYQTPLHALAEYAESSREFSADVASSLLKAGANPNLIDKNGDTPLHLMAKVQSYEIVSAVVSNLPATHPITSILDIRGGSLLHAVASSVAGYRVPLLTFLLDAGLEVNATDNCGRTALHLACQPRWGPCKGEAVIWDEEVVSTLLQRGANVLAADSAGRLPLHYLLVPSPENHSDNKDGLAFYYYPDIETAKKISNLLVRKNKRCLRQPDKNGFSALSLRSLVCKMRQEENQNPGGLSFYCFEEKWLDFPFPNLRFKPQGEFQNEIDLRVWSESTRRRYTDPDSLISRMIKTPAVGSPRLLEETKQINLQIHKLVNRITRSWLDCTSDAIGKECDLVGSCQEGTKSSLPNEYDFECRVKLIDSLIDKAHIQHRRSLEDKDLYIITLSGRGTFYNIPMLITDFVDTMTVALSEERTWKGLSLSLSKVNLGSKVLTLVLEWTGPTLFQMSISVDLALLINLDYNIVHLQRNLAISRPVPPAVRERLRIPGWHILCTRTERAQISFREIECSILHNLSAVEREGFTLAKTLTRRIITPQWGDDDQYKPSSYVLKLCLFDLLDPERSYPLLDVREDKIQCADDQLNTRKVLDCVIRIYQNLRQQLTDTQGVRDSDGRVRCYLVKDTKKVKGSRYVICFCDAVLQLLEDNDDINDL